MEPPQESANLRQKAVKGVIWSAVESWGRQAISFGVFFILARLLGPETFGLIALAGVFIAFVQVFLDQGLGTAIIQRKELESEHLDTAFWTNLATSTLLATLTVACAGFVANLFKEPQLTPILRLLSFNFVFGGLSSVQQAILQRNLAFKALAKRSLIAVIVSGAIGVVMAFLGFGVWSLVGQQLSSNLTQVFALWWVSDWRPGLKVSAKHFKELFAYGINVLGINLLNFFSLYSDNFLIGYFLGSVALGYYAVAYRILTIVSQLMISVLQKIAMPVFSRLQQEPEKMRQAFYSAIRLTSLFVFPVFIGMSILAPELIIVAFGKQWLPSIPVIRILSLAGILYAGFYYNGPILMAVGKPSWHLRLSLLQAVANVICFFVAVRWGIVAVAASYVTRGYVMSPVPVWVLCKVIHIDLATYIRQYLAPFVGSLIMVAAILGTKYLLGDVVYLNMLLAISIVIGAIVYSITIFAIAPKTFWQLINIFRSALPKST
ncbi:MAG: lipopolysaccharide biosynthesis protein [Fischerella sp.]|nr:lipopolysaccharide biosynthesis protein [Fischerella sp.]